MRKEKLALPALNAIDIDTEQERKLREKEHARKLKEDGIKDEITRKKNLKEKYLQEQIKKLAKSLSYFWPNEEEAQALAKKYYKRLPYTELPEDFHDEDLALVQLTYVFPKDGTIKNKYEAIGEGRFSNHFVLNRTVEPNNRGNWNNREIAVIIPFDKLKIRISNLLSEDTFILGDIKIPVGSTIIISKSKAEELGITEKTNTGHAKIKIVDVPFDHKSTEFDHFNDFQKQVLETLLENGYLPSKPNEKRIAEIAKKRYLGNSTHEYSVSGELEDYIERLELKHITDIDLLIDEIKRMSRELHPRLQRLPFSRQDEYRKLFTWLVKWLNLFGDEIGRVVDLTIKNTEPENIDYNKKVTKAKLQDIEGWIHYICVHTMNLDKIETELMEKIEKIRQSI